MNTIEPDAQKAKPARSIFIETDETVIRDITLFLQHHQSIAKRKIAKRRNIGILEGKLLFKEEGDGRITTEEFLGS
ncbi:MAG: hypothetical protein LBP25_01770 [Tannerellaceae bacterium]|nr:hypothetical protein [Tannerellaceae bacterium]